MENLDLTNEVKYSRMKSTGSILGIDIQYTAKRLIIKMPYVMLRYEI